MTTIAIADDHVLLRRGLANLLKDIGYDVPFEADNGQQLVTRLQSGLEPDLVLLDINMPVMDGYEAARWIKENKPLIKVLALSMYDDEHAIIKMLKSGARGYVLKDCEPAELQTALVSLLQKGYYYSELVSGKLIHSINQSGDGHSDDLSKINERELEFLKHTCSELTYKEIAALMFVSPRTIDGYRDSLFEKLNIRTRTGLAIYAIRKGIVKV